MMNEQNSGESSQHLQRGNLSDERPLKKARFVWEVKGNYHLKDKLKPTNDKNIESHSGVLKPETYLVENTVNNNLVDGSHSDDQVCQGNCCIESLLARTESLLDTQDEEMPLTNLEMSLYNKIPVSLVSPIPKNQDYYLQRWQARQLARSFVDNTINRVLETWMVSPFDPRFDATDFVENCENDGFVEDEGILMAIQSHGLQSGNSSENVDVSKTELDDDFACLSSKNALLKSSVDVYNGNDTKVITENVLSSSKNAFLNCSSTSDSIDSPTNSELNNSIDFLNAAVSVAIMKKGLSSYPCG